MEELKLHIETEPDFEEEVATPAEPVRDVASNFAPATRDAAMAPVGIGGGAGKYDRLIEERKQNAKFPHPKTPTGSLTPL
jgi:hypothetical protein